MFGPSFPRPRRTGVRGPVNSRAVRAALVGTLAVSLSATAVIGATSAAAAIPTFPDNLMVFPNRDFVTVEGYQNHIGETATVEIVRPGIGIVGSAQGVVAEGDVAFEINHPGGYCWGAGTGLQVTPDIQPGDIASIRFGDVKAGETRVQDGIVTADASVSTTTRDGDTVTVHGHLGADVIKENTEQRIIEPGLTDTAIGRRDIRAVPGPLTPAAKGGYSSSLEFDDADHTFTATYLFDDPAVAKIAANAGLGERLMSWELTDADANRQGMTIAEFGEPGGPGLGGCPNGPLQSGPPGPSDVRAANVSGALKLTWTPAVALPGTPAITGYRATAVAQAGSNGERAEIGRRISGQAAKGTTITGLVSGETYDVEVVAVSSVGTTFPPVTAVPEADVTPPTVSASPAGGSFPLPQKVTLKASEPGSDIYYTTDGTDPVQGDVLDVTALTYSEPFVVSETSTVKFVAFDPSGNVSAIGEQTITITNDPTPDAPTFGNPVIGQGTITLSWTTGAGTTPITGYRVQVYDKDAAAVGGPLDTTETTLAVGDLVEGSDYLFGVRAGNANGYGPESAKLGPLTPKGAVLANAGADQVGVVRGTNVTLSGAGSSNALTYRWTQLQTGTTVPVGAFDPDKVTVLNSDTLTAGFVMPFYAYPMTNKPLTFQLSVTDGSTTRVDEVVVTPRSDVVTIGTAKWKNNDFRITGTASTVGSVITVRSAPDATGRVRVFGTVAVTAAAAPAVGGVWDLRIKAGPGLPTTNPGKVFADSKLGGTAGPFTVSG
jgi:hypothetical protein